MRFFAKYASLIRHAPRLAMSRLVVWLFAFVATASLTLMMSATALACFAPSPPSQPWAHEPRTPACSIDGSGYNPCTEVDISRFRSDVESYIESMERYAEKAVRFANDANDYASCKANEAVDKWNRFVSY